MHKEVHEQGICPECGAELTYTDEVILDFADDGCPGADSIPFAACEVDCGCGYSGHEFYELVFSPGPKNHLRVVK